MPEFTPKPCKREGVTIRFENSTLEELERVAGLYKISRNELVVQCVHFALQNLSEFTPTTKEDE